MLGGEWVLLAGGAPSTHAEDVVWGATGVWMPKGHPEVCYEEVAVLSVAFVMYFIII